MIIGGLRASWLSPLAGILLCASLAACAGPPKGVLLPVAERAPGTATVDMIVATTRSPGETPVDMFTGERGREPAFANITVSIPPDSARTAGEVQWPSRVPGNPATDFVTLRADRLDRQAALDWFHKAVARTPKRRVLVFIHGFNNRFEDAVFRFAQIVHDSGSPVVPVLFTWPSRASILAYGYDRESSTYSRDALETLLTALARDPAVGEISVLAHSMGNWVTLEALRQMAIRNGRVAPKIRNVMLAAPDVDVDVFRTQLAAIRAPRPNVTLFVSQDDRALAVSRRIWGSSARLGAIDPEMEPYHTDLPRDGITVIDLTKLQTGDRLNHGKFAESPEVVQIIGQRLVAGQTMTDQRVGLGDRIIQLTAGAASTVGTAAGLVISAPVSVLDETSRGNYGTHVERLGGSISDTAEATGTLIVPQTSGHRRGTAAELPPP
ncbi:MULTISPECIES: alpha/beta hydrolase [unclassified Chelatococcus]|uniref:alpha/beta hydrolase n=1 Tax=unclassified Chelatococcus TaxID=2638111 RepID=UPI00031B8549|nr:MULTISPECIES: alpha/beta hydrolase [unclassified Chelatococcus]ALA16663.1 esterase [Chelatococcus sp. CO-6]